MALQIPHAELSVPEDSMEEYLDEEGNSIFEEVPFEGHRPQDKPFATYAGMVSRLDRHIGHLLDLLQELNIEENTLVVFTSDNGPHSEGGYDSAYFNSNGPLKGIKRDLYEGGIRVPMIGLDARNSTCGRGKQSGMVCLGFFTYGRRIGGNRSSCRY